MGLAFITATAAWAARPDRPAETNRYEQLARFARVLEIAHEHYVDEEPAAYNALLDGALDGLLRALDPHSQFMDADLYKDMQEETAGAFGGVGVVVTIRDGMLTIVSPIEDTPGFRAGLLSGDRIVEIDGESTEEMGMEDVVKHLRGDPGTEVSLGILRENEPGLKTVDLVRAMIDVPSVKDARMIEDGIGYVRVLQFNEPTAEDLRAAVSGLATQGLRGLVLDLRGNPGGLLPSAVDVCRLFLPSGSPVVFTRGRGGEIEQTFQAIGNALFADLDLAVLINGGSASASEIVAGALKDNRRAVLVGERTFGKGSVQSLIPLDDGEAVRLTTARYYTPSENVIQDRGIEPDLVAPMGPEQWLELMEERADPHAQPNDAKDAQLRRAVDLLRGLRILHARDAARRDTL